MDTHGVPGLGWAAAEAPELVQGTEGLVQAVGTVNFLGTLGHHSRLEQGCIQGLLQAAPGSGAGLEHWGPPKSPKFPHLALTCLTVLGLFTSVTAPPRK